MHDAEALQVFHAGRNLRGEVDQTPVTGTTTQNHQIITQEAMETIW